MSVRGRQSSRRSTDGSRSHHSGDVEAASGADVDGDHVALLSGPGAAAAAAAAALDGAGKLDASAPIALDISPPTSRRAPSLKRRATLQSTSSGGHRPTWKLQYRDFVPPVSTSLLTGLAATGVCVDSSDPFQ